MNPLESFLDRAAEIEAQLGYTFKNRDLLVLAFIHRSFVNEHRALVQMHNERLEFLGDSILGLLIAEFLYNEKPNTPEGELSHIRSRLVQADACANYLESLAVHDALLLGKGERMSEGRGRLSIHADLFEAIIGAIFLDGGIEAAKTFLFSRFGTQIAALVACPGRNWKAELQDYAQREFHETPSYRVISETGPDHNKYFVVAVAIAGEVMGTGEGASKKEAQQAAAQTGVEKLVGGDS